MPSFWAFHNYYVFLDFECLLTKSGTWTKFWSWSQWTMAGRHKLTDLKLLKRGKCQNPQSYLEIEPVSTIFFFVSLNLQSNLFVKSHCMQLETNIEPRNRAKPVRGQNPPIGLFGPHQGSPKKRGGDQTDESAVHSRILLISMECLPNHIN